MNFRFTISSASPSEQASWASTTTFPLRGHHNNNHYHQFVFKVFRLLAYQSRFGSMPKWASEGVGTYHEKHETSRTDS